MTALAKLPEKWRALAALREKSFIAGDPVMAVAYRACADELTAAISPAELGGVEAVVGELRCDNEGGRTIKWRDGFHDVSGRTFFIVGTTPRAAEAISLVDIGLCNWAAHILSDPERFNTRANDASAAIRRLVAALTPPSAKGE